MKLASKVTAGLIPRGIMALALGLYGWIGSPPTFAQTAQTALPGQVSNQVDQHFRVVPAVVNSQTTRPDYHKTTHWYKNKHWWKRNAPIIGGAGGGALIGGLAGGGTGAIIGGAAGGGGGYLYKRYKHNHHHHHE